MTNSDYLSFGKENLPKIRKESEILRGIIIQFNFNVFHDPLMNVSAVMNYNHWEVVKIVVKKTHNWERIGYYIDCNG